MTKKNRLFPRWLVSRKPRRSEQDTNFNSKRDIGAQWSGSASEVQVTAAGSPVYASVEDPYETLCCLKWGAHYGVISEAAYESGKADLLARL